MLIFGSKRYGVWGAQQLEQNFWLRGARIIASHREQT